MQTMQGLHVVPIHCTRKEYSPCPASRKPILRLNLHIQLETISKLQERDPVRAVEEVTEARQVAAQAMQEVRNAVAALRPTSIGTLSLTEALTQLGREFECNTEEAELILDLDSPVPPISPGLHVALYRAAQEALTNIRKHAHATKVLVRLRYEDETLELVVLDNGCGTPHSNDGERSGGFGLIGLRERIELLGGKVSYGPSTPSGYRVTVQIRVPSAEEPLRSGCLANVRTCEEERHEPAHFARGIMVADNEGQQKEKMNVFFRQTR